MSISSHIYTFAQFFIILFLALVTKHVHVARTRCSDNMCAFIMINSNCYIIREQNLRKKAVICNLCARVECVLDLSPKGSLIVSCLALNMLP